MRSRSARSPYRCTCSTKAGSSWRACCRAAAAPRARRKPTRTDGAVPSGDLVHGARRRLHLALVVDQTRRQPRVGDLVGRGRGDHFALEQSLHRLLRRAPLHLEADDAGRQRRIARREHFHPGDGCQGLLALGVESRDARGDARSSDAAVKLERFGHRPLVLVGLEAARRDPGRAGRSPRRMAILPGRKRLGAVEARDRRAQQRPVLLRRPDDAGAARRKNPLVRARGGEVDAQPGERHILVPESMHRVQHHEHALALAAVAVCLGDGLCQRAHRQLDAGAGVHPREPDDARARADGAAQAFHHLFRRRRFRRIVGRNAPPAGAIALGGQADRLVMHVMVMSRGEDLVAGSEGEAVVDQGETRRRAVGERNLVRPPAEILRGRLLHPHRKGNILRLLPEEGREPHAVLDGGERIGVEHASVALDRFAHRARVRHDVELREVQPLGRQVELYAHLGPVGEVLSPRRCGGLGQVADATAAAAAPARTLFGQPRGLATLFLTEMWERFTYYGMRGVLILFMVAAVSHGGLGLDDKTASAIYGMYIGGTYLFGLLGGWIADRLIGAQRAVVAGGVLIAGGNLMLALGSTDVFFLGLLVITIGVGLLKPNASAMVAALYPEGGSRRDAGFSVFYMGINLGALIGPLIVGWFADRYGWRWGFAVPALGMAVGLAQFVWTRHYLGNAGVAAAGEQPGAWKVVVAIAAAVALAAALVMAGVLKIDAVGLGAGGCAALLVAGVGV